MRTARAALLILALTATYSSTLLAQSSPPDFIVEFEQHFNASAEKVVALARAMPEETYTWRPMEGVASVVRVYMHIARYNYYYPDVAMDVPSPMGAAEYDSWEDGVVDKEKAIAILTESMEHVKRVAASMSSMDLEVKTRLYDRDIGQWAVLLQLVAHMNEHLGQSIAYARTHNVVPPWSM
jgi:uncharacterized damage-inducible protein DinB